MANPGLRILILEDNQFDFELLLSELHRSGVEFSSTRVDTQQDYLRQVSTRPDIILADYYLPQFNALQALEILQKSKLDIPFIVVTGSISEEVAVESIKRGASDYLIKDRLGRLQQAIERALEQKRLRDEKHLADQALRASEDKFSKAFHMLPDAMSIHDYESGRFQEVNQGFVDMSGYSADLAVGATPADLNLWVVREDRREFIHLLEAHGEVRNYETLYRKKNGEVFNCLLSARLIGLNGQTSILVISRDITRQKQAENELKQAHFELAEAYDATIEGWARAMELRDRETKDHARRVVDLTLALARQLNISEEELVNIRRGVLLHDIGKMAVPDSILQKEGPLTDEDWVIMKQHPDYAYQMLSSIDYLRPALDVPYCHHEHWDGSGYPRGLQGDEIPLSARLFAIVDVWDALLSDRPYRAAVSRDEAFAYIKEQSGRYFDPMVVDLFLSLIEKENL